MIPTAGINHRLLSLSSSTKKSCFLFNNTTLCLRSIKIAPLNSRTTWSASSLSSSGSNNFKNNNNSIVASNIPLADLLPQPVITPEGNEQTTTLSAKVTSTHQITIPALLAANVHLGASKLNRSMLPYIYGVRNRLNIINLEHTIVHLRRAMNVARQVAMMNGVILFVGSRPSIQHIVVNAALKANAYYALKWTGGTLTNKERVLRKSVGFDPDKVAQVKMNTNFKISQEYGAGPENEEFFEEEEERYDALLDAESERGSNSSDPSAQQPKVPIPDLMVVLDYPNSIWAVKEANITNIPVIAICDADMNPNLVQYPIPANDDSSSSIELIAGLISKACREGEEIKNSRMR